MKKLFLYALFIILFCPIPAYGQLAMTWQELKMRSDIRVLERDVTTLEQKVHDLETRQTELETRLAILSKGQLELYRRHRTTLEFDMVWAEERPEGYHIHLQSGVYVPKEQWLLAAHDELSALTSHIETLESYSE
jgi:hypothetical protein